MQARKQDTVWSLKTQYNLKYQELMDNDPELLDAALTDKLLISRFAIDMESTHADYNGCELSESMEEPDKFCLALMWVQPTDAPVESQLSICPRFGELIAILQKTQSMQHCNNSNRM